MSSQFRLFLGLALAGLILADPALAQSIDLSELSR